MEYPTPDGLKYRADQRRQDRKNLAQRRAILRMRERKKALDDKARQEMKDRNRAIVYLTTLPTEKLLAVYEAALNRFEA